MSNVLAFPSRPSVELIPFGSNRTFEAIRSSGQGHLILKPLFESFGISWEGQRKWLQRQVWATTSILEAVGADGKVREMVTLPISRAAMLFATLDASKVADATLRKDVEELQCEGADVLDRWFRGAAFVRAAEPVDSFGRLEEWERVRKNVDIAGRVLSVVTEDISRLGSGQAALETKLNDLSDYAERLELELHRDKPTAEQRAELVRSIGAACECRVSERERLMLVHIAEQGPATSQGKIGAAARVSHETARRALQTLSERCIVEVFQRDPVSPKLYGFHVIAEGLEGHAENCEIEYKRGAAALAQMLEMTSSEAVHTVPPNIPHIPLPQVGAESQPKTERELLVKHIGTYGKQRDWQDEDYHRAYNRIYANLATMGLECRGKRDGSGKKIRPLDVVEARGWCGHALQIAQELYPISGEK